VVRPKHVRPRGGRAFAHSLGFGTKNQSRKPDVRSSFPIDWFISCNGSLFSPMTHTMQETQVHCSGFVQWWVYSSLMSAPLPAEAGWKTCERIIPLVVFIVRQWHGNKFQMFTSS